MSDQQDVEPPTERESASDHVEDIGAPPPVVTEPDDAEPAMPEPRVEVHRNVEGGRYELTIDDRIAGYSEYLATDGRIVITHTATLPAYKGRGVASTLVKQMLSDIGGRGERAVVKCPFVAGYLAENHEFDDIIDG